MGRLIQRDAPLTLRLSNLYVNSINSHDHVYDVHFAKTKTYKLDGHHSCKLYHARKLVSKWGRLLDQGGATVSRGHSYTAYLTNKSARVRSHGSNRVLGNAIRR